MPSIACRLTLLSCLLVVPGLANSVPITLDVDPSISAITSVNPDEPLAGSVSADFEFSDLQFSGGSSIAAASPVTFSGSISTAASLPASLTAEINASMDITYTGLEFDIDAGTASNGSSPSDQLWSAHSTAALNARGSINVPGIGELTFEVNSTKLVNSLPSQLEGAGTVSLSSGTAGTNLSMPFQTRLPISIEPADITLGGDVGPFGPLVNTLLPLLANQLNALAPTVSGVVTANSPTELDIPESATYTISPSESVLHITTADGLNVSTNLLGSLNGLRNSTSLRLDNSSTQQVNASTAIDPLTLNLGTFGGIQLSSTADALSLSMSYGIGSEVFGDGASADAVDLRVDMLTVQVSGDLVAESIFGTEVLPFTLTGTMDPFVLALAGTTPISLSSDGSSELLIIPFDVLISPDFLLGLTSFDLSVEGSSLIAQLVGTANLLLNSPVANLLTPVFENLNLAGQVVARRSLDIPEPPILGLLGFCLLIFAFKRCGPAGLPRNRFHES